MMTGTRCPLRVQLSKRTDGRVVLRCERTDGSATWQRQEGGYAQFFPFHDLIHLALESTLGFRDGFFGLIAQGWDIGDTEGKGPRGPLPPEAILVEHLVGLLSVDRVGGNPPLSAGELNAQVAELVAQGRIASARTIGDEELAAVRARIDELHAEWAALPSGGVMEVRFGE